jgi:23S rRNA pseudouridine1911/1915/1917 synthase
VPASEPTDQTVLTWLSQRHPTSKRQTLRRMLQAGRVTVNGRVIRNAKVSLAPNDRVVVSDAPRTPVPVRDTHRPAALRIVHEDADLLVVDKPPGLLTSTNPRERRPTLLALVRTYVESQAELHRRRAQVGLIHRLDRDASGLLVFSKTHDAYLSLKRQFFEHSVERVYTAIVEGAPTPPTGRVESRLVERADGTVYSTSKPGQGERAVSDYEVIERRNRRSLVRVTLHTGRKHQIRVHLSDRGSPIVGDTVYGRTAKPAKGITAPRLMLAATKLAFAHPRTGQRLTFELPTPPEFAAAFASPRPVRADDVRQ